jgi:beta-glucosidase
MDLSELNQKSSAILQAWYPGARGGQSIGDILFGKVNPSGKLPVTFYKDTNDLPDFEDYSMKGRTYRYLETEPLYPFGYGLTYGKLDITNVSYTGEDAKNSGITVKVDVANTGDIATTEVVQVYMKAEDANEVKNTRLAGFARITLDAGKNGSVEIPVAADRFKVVNDKGDKVLADGKINFFVGFGQPDSLTEKLTGKKAATFAI